MKAKQPTKKNQKDKKPAIKGKTTKTAKSPKKQKHTLKSHGDRLQK